MSLESLLAHLNPEQREAAMHVEGPLLVLAGAGSGKTKTLTTRLAYLLAQVGIPANNTLTLTFTNKAAHEMCTRAMGLLSACGHPLSQKPLLCTFHSFGLLFLRKHMGYLERLPDFTLIKPQDACALLKPQFLALRKKTGDIEDRIFLASLMKKISQIKNHLTDLKNCPPYAQTAYHLYTETLYRQNLVDFDDLLALPHAILDHFPEAAQEISQYYQFIMVDEYQDTNPLQFKLLQRLCSTHQNLCVVGDDDQSIYGFRGADISNILDFTQRFKQARLIKLEQNYRSSKSILACANQLIGHNQRRHGKTLFSDKQPSKYQKLEVLCLFDAKQESHFITQKILECTQRGVPYSDIAILYRLNYLSKGVEETLRHAKIPYQIIGGIGFYDRAEIKDLLAYLRVLENFHDDASLLRILNKPARGLSKSTAESITQVARDHVISIYSAYQQGLLEKILSKKAHRALQNFFAMLESFKPAVQSFSYAQQAYHFINTFVKSIGLKDTFKDSIEDRLDNLEEFFDMFETFCANRLEAGHPSNLRDFLDQSILEAPAPKDQEAIKCMSVHASKGLEFRVVFIVGFEEGFFPYIPYHQEPNLEEERRLGYVAITRAKEELYICTLKERVYFGSKQYLEPSSFLEEAKLLEPSATWRIGDRVSHRAFGHGQIKSVHDQKVQVDFGNDKIYWLMASMLEKKGSGC